MLGKGTGWLPADLKETCLRCFKLSSITFLGVITEAAVCSECVVVDLLYVLPPECVVFILNCSSCYIAYVPLPSRGMQSPHSMKQ